VAALAALRAERDVLAAAMVRNHTRAEKAEAERDGALTRLAAAEAQVGALQSWFRRRYSGGHDEGCAAKTHVNRSCSCGWDTLYAALASAAGGAK
jgi:hypothetical protein